MIPGPQEAVYIILFVGMFMFVVSMLIHVLKNTNLGKKAKLVWVLGLLLLGPFGAVFYLATDYRYQKPAGSV